MSTPPYVAAYRSRTPRTSGARGCYRVLDDRATRRVDEDGDRLHPPQRHSIKEVAGLRRKRRLNDQIVRDFDKPIEGNGLYPPDLLIRPGSPARRMALADGSRYLAPPWAHFRPLILRWNRTQRRCQEGADQRARPAPGQPALLASQRHLGAARRIAAEEAERV